MCTLHKNTFLTSDIFGHLWTLKGGNQLRSKLGLQWKVWGDKLIT